jgi:hypothetical protein
MGEKKSAQERLAQRELDQQDENVRVAKINSDKEAEDRRNVTANNKT